LGSQTLKLLPIVLIFSDLLARGVLFPVELFLLAPGQMIVVGGHIILPLVLDILFAILQAQSLARRQRSVLHAIRDPVLRVRLAAIDFVDARMTGIDLAWSGTGSVAVLSLSRGATNKHPTTHCHD
jgi:hypothetical protein